MEWRTQLNATDTADYGVAEAHAVFFQPLGDVGGDRPAVVFAIPETEDITAGLRLARIKKARVASCAIPVSRLKASHAWRRRRSRNIGGCRSSLPKLVNGGSGVRRSRRE
jgi:hypothetical protein